MDYNLRKNKLIQIILLPFSWLYLLGITIRNLFYDMEWFRIYRFEVPVISVGNLLAGGSGKTPVTMLLIEKLSTKYQNIAIVSRGYGRSSKGLQVVSDGMGKRATADIGGDEPVMMAGKFPNIPVIVSENRAAGIKLAINKFHSEVILLDDAFQHRKVSRDVDIVLLDRNRDPRREKPLPAGDRREPLSALTRSDIIIYTKKMNMDNGKNPFGLNRWFNGESYNSEYKPLRFKNLATNSDLHLDELADSPAIAFSGIASPVFFEQSLNELKINLYRAYHFADHHVYSSKDFEMIKSGAIAHNCKYIITTEKDAVKIPQNEFAEFEFLVLEMAVVIQNEKNLLENILYHIDLKMKSD
jgi:tetraacyldisaccharide 4'-kinase